MSKKSRKKSPKVAPKRKVAAKTSKGSKTAGRKASPQAASSSNKKRSSGTSHKAASKRLKSPSTSTAAAPRKPPSADTAPAAGPKGPAAGTKAPAFNLPRDGGGNIALSDFGGKKLVLFFYPRADTPGCTREAIDFTRLKGAFAESGTEVLGISADSLSAQERFRDKHGLEVPLISDEKHQMLEAYGAWGEKSMYGRTFLGIIRTTVLIDASGTIARVWRHVKVDGHADDVLAAAQAL